VNPGYGGPKYIDTAIGKIQELRRRFPHLHISVDGGVNESNARVLVEAGANVLVAGSSIFGPDPPQAIQNLKKSAAGAAVTTDLRMLQP
jgi:ribulose-phosphate 3-epimerase